MRSHLRNVLKQKCFEIAFLHQTSEENSMGSRSISISFDSRGGLVMDAGDHLLFKITSLNINCIKYKISFIYLQSI